MRARWPGCSAPITAAAWSRPMISARSTLAAMFDEPFADASALPTWRVCQLARETVTVALSGDGADEALAGYRRHVFQHGEDRHALYPAACRAPGRCSARWGPSIPRRTGRPGRCAPRPRCSRSPRASEEGYARALSVCRRTCAIRSILPISCGLRGDYRAEARAAGADARRARAVRAGRAQYADLKFWLPGDILTKVDRASMAVSLEAREPLLDHRLIEFAAACPKRCARGGAGQVADEARDAALPARHILYRPKQGFVTPIAQWLRGPLAGQRAGDREAPRWRAPAGSIPKRLRRDLPIAHIAGRSPTIRACSGNC
jgi:asparagine synthase (glutamine-hydrolysing)